MWRGLQTVAQSRSAGLVFVTVFTVSIFASLFFASGRMDIAMGSVGCPFMLHEETLCSMGVLDHVGAWESAFAAVMPGLTLLFFAIFFAFAVFSTLPRFLDHRKSGSYYFAHAFLERKLTFSHRPLQELFARGILHPKLF